MREHALGAVAVLRLALAALERAEHAELALDGDAGPMRHLRDLLGDADIVGVVGRRLAVCLERAVHHHRGEAVLDRGGAGRLVAAVVEVHADGDVRVDLDEPVDQLGQHDVVGVGARALARLQDHRRIGGVGGRHDGEPLLHVVHVEGRHAVPVLGGVIQQLPQADPCHRCPLLAALVRPDGGGLSGWSGASGCSEPHVLYGEINCGFGGCHLSPSSTFQISLTSVQSDMAASRLNHSDVFMLAIGYGENSGPVRRAWLPRSKKTRPGGRSLSPHRGLELRCSAVRAAPRRPEASCPPAIRGTRRRPSRRR